MTHAAEMLRTYPADLGDVDRAALARCIAECFDCSQTCTACADACLSEPGVSDLIKCIRTCLDCADICGATGRVLSRHTGYDANLTRAHRTRLTAAGGPRLVGGLTRPGPAVVLVAKVVIEGDVPGPGLVAVVGTHQQLGAVDRAPVWVGQGVAGPGVDDGPEGVL